MDGIWYFLAPQRGQMFIDLIKDRSFPVGSNMDIYISETEQAWIYNPSIFREGGVSEQ